MLLRSSDHVYQSELLLEHSWLTHGFGTRRSDDWPGPYASLKQIHSDIVYAVDEPEVGVLGRGDALITAAPGALVGVRTADCVPILLADVEHRAVAAVHAGWRGTAQAIAAKTVERMREVFGTDWGSLRVAIGPCIGACCYEVGPEVLEQFREVLELPPAATHIDLYEANRRQLIAAGVSSANIDGGSLCTRCGEEFHSWRRDREASGRMVAAIGIQG